VHNRDGKIFIEDAYKEKDWLASADMNFRPINTYTGPDGCFYIVDMYHGIIQESEWTTPDSYLGKMIAEKELYKNRGMGRIYRVVYEGFERDNTRPNMLNEPPSKLVTYLSHPNGWWRDMAQQTLIVRNDTSIATELRRIALSSPDHLARIHALWTLEGLQVIDKKTLFTAFKDKEPQVRKTAVWISEMYIKKNDKQVLDSLDRLKNDESADVKVQLSLSLRSAKAPAAKKIVKHLLDSNASNVMMHFSYTTFVEAEKNRVAELMRTKNLGPAERKLIAEGSKIYKQLCATCHGADGKGVNIPGKDMPAPPIAGSPRVKGDKIALTQLLLNGLTGPVDGKTYADKMPSMWGQSDEWIASVLSYIRNSGDMGNKASVVTTEEVKETRANTPRIPEGMTLQMLEIFKLGRAERSNWDKKE
jgi:mono/diheme cytochrome c family protein